MKKKEIVRAKGKVLGIDPIFTMSRPKSRIERILDKKQSEEEHRKHEKRKKFRALAHRFIDWRKYKQEEE